jgi:hypothetical protein
MNLHPPKTSSEVRLPDIPLSALPERTKDFLIATSGGAKPISGVVADVLNAAATAGRFAASTTCNTSEEAAR